MMKFLEFFRRHPGCSACFIALIVYLSVEARPCIAATSRNIALVFASVSSCSTTR